MSWDTVRLEWDEDGDVATVLIDRPDAMNAMNVETIGALQEAFTEAEAGDARALVVTGAGDEAFVAGADIAFMRELDTAEAHDYCKQGHRLTRQVEEFPAPVVAAINGYCLGGGMELALACDLRIASERAVLGQPEIDIGIVPGWGGSQRLPRLVGDELARRLIFFGERVDAEDAHEMGIVGEVVAHAQLADHAAETAADIAAKPATAMRAAKECLNAYHETGATGGLAVEARAFSGLFGTHDQREGMDAFLGKRDAEFE